MLFVFWVIFLSDIYFSSLQVREALELLGYNDPLPMRGIRILSLDGGGMRGMVTLEILGAIERTTGKRIHELFDFVCGVSTGSIIASFLAFHKKSVKDVEETYDRLGREVFSQDLFHGARGWVLSHSYYDTRKYEETLRGFVGKMKLSETVRSEGTPKTAIISTLVSGHRIMPYIFRNYQYPYRSQSFYRGTARWVLFGLGHFCRPLILMIFPVQVCHMGGRARVFRRSRVL